LRRVLSNLLSNAVGFSLERGSVSLSLRIEVSFLLAGVRENGPGFPDEVFHQITERLFANRATTGISGKTVSAQETAV
jgi:signal transduction histidine kinase